MADITIVNGVYKPTYNWGAPSCSNLHWNPPKNNPPIPAAETDLFPRFGG